MIGPGLPRRHIRTHIGEPAKAQPIWPARGPPGWDDTPKPMPDWDSIAQPAPDFGFDQRIAWYAMPSSPESVSYNHSYRTRHLCYCPPSFRLAGLPRVPPKPARDPQTAARSVLIAVPPPDTPFSYLVLRPVSSGVHLSVGIPHQSSHWDGNTRVLEGFHPADYASANT